MVEKVRETRNAITVPHSCVDGTCTGSWTVPGGAPTGSNNYIRITKSDDPSVTDTSDKFTIVFGGAG
ncbi:MAG: hypothetical protein Q8Q48_01230 [Candidatus Staskawiczbacteria bacterium]|nr:hypothetical protein [Candidatus Staskawiczbacteria bacterium]